MTDLNSPKYQMELISFIKKAVYEEYKEPNQVQFYIKKWHKIDVDEEFDIDTENFKINKNIDGDIDLDSTLNLMDTTLLLKIATDLGFETPYFIPSISSFRNELKDNYKIAYNTFETAYNQVEHDPSSAIGFANSVLESIIKEILRDDLISVEISGNETLYDLAKKIVKAFNINDTEHPIEIKTINSSLLGISQAIEKVRSEKTNFHGKSTGDIIINDSIYAYFILNAVSTIGLFFISYYNKKYLSQAIKNVVDNLDE